MRNSDENVQVKRLIKEQAKRLDKKKEEEQEGGEKQSRSKTAPRSLSKKKAVERDEGDFAFN